ncbi:MAG: Uncharacterized protein XD94_1238 [Mesotoga prima]|uniref:Epoxyqueuosine reductase QueH n=1 Tax=Mesotoga prima TaxID=1184387 RepID=A0A101HNI0_9BACT|nr:MAG: Uncharacterized protein XD94_1238 [Mesotoga prima]
MNLLHVCCAPDLVSSVLRREELKHSMLLFYNPNIYPEEEFFKRYHAFRRVCQEMGVECPEPDYSPEDFSAIHDSFEDEPEGGMRCTKCIELRLRKAAEAAKSLGAKSFSTTLLASPQKPIYLICQIGQKVSESFDLEFISENLRLERGKLNQFLGNVYVQNYCGCKSSLKEIVQTREIKKRRDKEALERDFSCFADLWRFRGAVISRSSIPVEEVSVLKELITLIKPCALLDDVEDVSLQGKRWLKTGSYNCRIIREKK